MDLSGGHWKRACTHADLLRVYAFITFFAGIALGMAGRHFHSTFLPELRRPFLCTAAIVVLLSLGSFFNLKIVSAMYGAAAAVFGGWVIVSGLRYACDKPRLAGEMPFMLLVVLIGLLFFLPIYSTWRAWKALR